jgi:CelD/BcsL family acetyltransferase involved in cellulose biosynthesis
MVRSIQQFEALRDGWDALAARFENPLLEHDWFASCAAAFNRDGDLRVLTVNSGGAITGAAALVSESSSQSPRVTLLGTSKLYEPSGWLFDSHATLSELADRVVRLASPILLQRVPVDSPMYRVLAAQPWRRALIVARDTATSLGVPVRQSWEDYYAGLSTRITGNLRRLRKKAEQAHGSMSFTRLEPSAAEVDGLLEAFVSVEASGWKGRRGSALGSRPDLRDFFRRYCHRAAGRKRLRVATLKFGSTVAAMELAIEAYGRVWQLKIGFNDAVADYYPGLHLTEMCLKAAFERRLDAYEFLGSAEGWQERWRSEPRIYQIIAIYPTNATGIKSLCRDVADSVWRRAHTMRRPVAATP